MTLTGKSGSVSVASLLLSPGSWYAQGFVVPYKGLFPQSSGRSVIKSHWPSKSVSLGFLSPFARSPRSVKSLADPRTFKAVWELLWYNCSPVCGLSAWWLSGEAHMLCLPGLLQPEPLSPQQAIADPCCCKRHSNTQRQVWLSLMWGSQVLVHTRFCLTPLSISGWSEVWF